VTPLLLNLFGRSYGPDGARVLSKFFLAFSDRIVSIDFSGILDSLPKDDELNVLELLVGSLQESPLAALKLSDMALGRDGILRLLQPLMIKNTLPKLFLDNAGLGEGSTSTLSDILVQNQVPLEVISCSRNAMGVDGAKHLGDIIRGLKTLREIFYIDCHRGTESIAYPVQKARKILPMP